MPAVSGKSVLLTLVLGVTVTALAGSCTEAQSGGVSADMTTTGVAESAWYMHQNIDWGPCQGILSDPNPAPSVVCGTIQAPVDYAKPDGDRVTLQLSKVPARAEKRGSMLTNPGGPGGPGIDLAPVVADSDFAANYDVIGIDQRGIGKSTPAITCLDDAQWDADRVFDDLDRSADEVANTEARRQRFADACRENTGDLLGHVGSVDIVRDFEVIRAGLGENKIDYLGLSYGTFLGEMYAKTFPDRVQSMILDGVVDPSASELDMSLGQNSGFQQVFSAFAADCASHLLCPIGQDPAAATASFQQLVRPLIDRPAFTVDGRGLGYRDAVTGVTQALYSPQMWDPLREALAALRVGSGDGLQVFSDLYMGRDPKGHYDNSQAAFSSISCLEFPRITDRAQTEQLAAQARAVAPFSDPGVGSTQASLEQCAFWPYALQRDPQPLDGDDLRARGLPPVLVVSTTDDPATPYRNGEAVAQQLGAPLVTFNGAQHTVTLDKNQCVDDVVSRYLADPSAQVDGTHC